MSYALFNIVTANGTKFSFKSLDLDYKKDLEKLVPHSYEKNERGEAGQRSGKGLHRIRF